MYVGTYIATVLIMNFVSYSYYILMYVSQGDTTPLDVARNDKVVKVLLRSGAKVSHHVYSYYVTVVCTVCMW